MKSLSIQTNKTLLICYGILALLLSSCTTNPGLPDESELPLDDQGRPYYPCEGDLCFKGVNDAEYQDALTALRDAVREESDEAKADVEQLILNLADYYGSCNFYKGTTGIVEADCPSWARVYGCPNSFFRFDRGTHIFRRAGQDEHFYCVGDRSPESENCVGSMHCPNGQVCSGSLSNTWTAVADGQQQPRPRCIDASLCLDIEGAENYSAADSCFYPDFTRPESGTIAPQDCDALPKGACAINCACPDHTGVIAGTGVPSHCHFLSEAQPVGSCGSTPCTEDAECIAPNSVCAFTERPDWASSFVETYQANRKPGQMIAHTGVCLDRARCNAWAAETPDAVRCGGPL